MRRPVIAALVVLLLSACVQFPTEKNESVDLRPQLSFAMGGSATSPAELDVLVDGLPVGRVTTFLSGEQAIRVLPGTHVITIKRGTQVVQEERLFFGDGMTKTLVVQ